MKVMEYEDNLIQTGQWEIIPSECTFCFDWNKEINEQLNSNLGRVRNYQDILNFIFVSSGVSPILCGSGLLYSQPGGTVMTIDRESLFLGNSRSVAMIPYDLVENMCLKEVIRGYQYPFIKIEKVIDNQEFEFDTYTKMPPKRRYSIELIIDKVTRATPKIVIE